MWPLRRRTRASNDPRYAAPPDDVGGDARVMTVLPKVVRWTLLAALAVGLAAAWLVAGAAEALTGRVVGIADGDTLTVLVDRQPIKVRLADIDAPESRQAFGSRSKQALSDLCSGKDARLEAQGRDRYGRTIATVHCAGRDANAEQVWQGMAWVFDRYAKADSPLYFLQQQAKAARRGLWSEPNPVAPWAWRARGDAPASGAEAGSATAAPRRWTCDRREVAGQDHVAIDCGWR